MENVTLNQKEQARLQVLNSLLAGHMTIEQASTLMGVSIRHAWRILAAYRKGQPPWLTVIEVAERPTRYWRQRRPLCCIWHAHGTREPTTHI